MAKGLIGGPCKAISGGIVLTFGDGINVGDVYLHTSGGRFFKKSFIHINTHAHGVRKQWHTRTTRLPVPVKVSQREKVVYASGTRIVPLMTVTALPDTTTIPSPSPRVKTQSKSALLEDSCEDRSLSSPSFDE